MPKNDALIPQGSNSPITLTFTDEVNPSAFSAVLVAAGRIVKRWSAANVGAAGNIVILPLTETETAAFPEGKALLEVKWLDGDVVIFAESIPMEIGERIDRGVRLNG